MPSTILSNPGLIEIDGVDLTNQCTSAVFTFVKEALENTAFGQVARTSTSGLENNTVTLTMYMSYEAAETFATLQPLTGTQVTVKGKPSDGAVSATNPMSVMTGTYFGSLPVMNMALGELSTVDIEFVGGAYTSETV